ncbi:MAG: hypothetical protein M1834_008230 [Cirrosporium novae-zelandiae]|nr:MAG: hypothetical protein M1834_008230 [Cirrosporium novae-zelandiae]
MSASPVGTPPGRTPPGRTPNGGPVIIRRTRNADPLRRQKPKPRVPLPPPQASSLALGNARPVGNTILKSSNSQPQGLPAPRLTRPLPTQGPIAPSSSTSSSSFSRNPVEPYEDIPLITTKRSLLEGYRYHVAKLYSKNHDVDLRNESEFTRPVRLHRRDPRAPRPGAAKTEDIKDESEMNGLDEKEREMMAAAKETRQAERQANLAKIAPSATTTTQKKPNAFKKKTQQVYRNDLTDAQKAQSKLRYEEALPWHIEDFDNKNIWVGNYEAALSENYAILVREGSTFKLVPAEKWYKFTQKSQFRAMTIEEAEAELKKKSALPRWYKDQKEKDEAKKQQQADRKAMSGLFIGKWERGSSGMTAASEVKREEMDADDLDFEEDRFADDEENPIFEGDEEEGKQAEDRIRRDRLQANVFDLKEEKDIEKDEKRREKDDALSKLVGKKVRKALMKREKNFNYEHDSDGNPYSEESEDSDDTETERLKEEERKKEAEKKLNSKGKDSDKASSGSSTKGNNTPSGRNKYKDALKKPKPAKTLKRPGSPHVSDPDRSGVSQRKSSIDKLPINGNKLNEISSIAPRPDNKRIRGAGSNSEGDFGSGTDGGSKKRIKLRVDSHSPSNGNTPRGSRAGSPAVFGVHGQSQKDNFPTIDEVIASIPPDTGCTIQEMVAKFKPRLEGGDQKAFVFLIKSVTQFDNKTKILTRKQS